MENRSHQKSLLAVWLTALPAAPEHPPLAGNSVLMRAKDAADELGLFFEFRNIGQGSDAKRIFREIDARGCDGIVWGRCILQDLPKNLPWDRYSVVSTEQANVKLGFDVVGSNHFRSTYSTLIRLREHGYRRIGFLYREHVPRHPDDEARFGGYAAFSEFHTPVNDRVPPLRLPYRTPDIPDRIQSWVRKNRIEVVVGFNVEEYKLLKTLGLKIPEDLAFAALHVCKPEQGMLAGLQHNEELIPRQAMIALTEKMRHRMKGFSHAAREILISPPFIPGESCPEIFRPKIQ